MSSTLDDQQQMSPEVPPFPVRRWTLKEYHSLIEQGMFEDERVELLEGWIVPKMTRNPPHDATVAFLDEVIRPLIGISNHLRIQSAISLERSEPEPDLAVVRGGARDYRTRHPGEGDLLIVVEIADTSLPKDRRKRAIYAGAGVPVYWIVNLNEQLVEVYSDPDQLKKIYRQQANFGVGMSVPVSVGGADSFIAVEDIFPQ